MKSKDQIEFISHFNSLKSFVNKKPEKISSVINKNRKLDVTIFMLWWSDRVIKKFFSVKQNKTVLTEKGFKTAYAEYENKYRQHIDASIESGKISIYNDLVEKIESGEIAVPETQLGTGDYFSPVEDDPSVCINNGFEVLRDVADSMNLEDCDKAIGALEFYENSIGLDLRNIYQLWKEAPDVFIPNHVSVKLPYTLYHFYDQAVKSFIFGCYEASIALGRALLEYVLKTQYSCKGKNLEELIDNVLSEQHSKNIGLQNLDLHHKRLLANRILHSFSPRNEAKKEDVLKYLNTLKALIELIPKKDNN